MNDADICPSCLGSGERLLPVKDAYGEPTVETFPCPVCRVWLNGFPGEVLAVDGVDHVVIERSLPGELAVYRGFPKV